MLHWIRKIGKDEWRYAFIVPGTTNKLDDYKILEQRNSYANFMILIGMIAAIGAFMAFPLVRVGIPSLQAGDMGGLALIILCSVSITGLLILIGMFVVKIVQEFRSRRHVIRPTARYVYSDAEPFKALIDTLGPKTWQTVLNQTLRSQLSGGITGLGMALNFQMNVYFDNMYAAFVTPDGILDDSTLSARGRATLEANVKQTATKIRSLIKQEEQRVEGRKKELAAIEEAAQVEETERKQRNLAIAARA